MYLFAAVVFSLRTSRRTESPTILVVWSFIVLHIGYGLGSLWGIITILFKFPKRHKQHIGKALADRNHSQSDKLMQEKIYKKTDDTIS